MIEYDDFDLRILADGEKRFWVSAQYGERVARELLPLDRPESWDLWNPREHRAEEAFALGAKLFLALFRDSVLKLYDQANGTLKSLPDRGLRIRIRLEPRDPRLDWIRRVPWEVLVDPRGEPCRHIGRDPRTPIVRTLESAAEILPSEQEGRLKVLLALADPLMEPRLDLETERRNICDVLEPTGAEVEPLYQVTRSEFQRRIRDGGFHVVHYMGHGEFEAGDLQGSLLIEGRKRKPDPLPGSTFAEFFGGRPMPRLIVLSACQTGEEGGSQKIGPYAGVAAALIGAGLPSVVAMQAKVRDRSAILFTKRLYERLVRGDSIEESVVEGRKELALEYPATPDWAVTVHFVRERSDSPFPPDRRIREGIQFFLAGDFRKAVQKLEQVPEQDDVFLEGLLYWRLCRIAATPSLPLDKLEEVDRDLQRCLASPKPVVAGIAKLALGIHRFDRMELRRFRTQGVESGALYRELESSRRSDLECKIARILGASRDAKFRFNVR